MGGIFKCPHEGCSIPCHLRKASRRKSSSHCGSSFKAEMRRMISSFRPLGIKTCCTSVTNPSLYSWEVNSCMILSDSFTNTYIFSKSARTMAVTASTMTGVRKAKQVS